MISRVRGGVGMGVGRWFDDNVRKVVGGGRITFCWSDNWVGGVPLRDRFPILFSLAEDRWVTVAEMEGGWLEVVGVSGGGASLHGRKRVWWSVLLFCRITFMTGGVGFLILFMAIQSKVSIIFSRRWRHLMIGVCRSMYGINELH
ncbi:hypothetical protein MtrunA17_Chr6g0454731 [Medicago truncatula]|uniref:Transmembrane protein n=1 Tax=Medicago truncatula TaxID=3880 RepID=A0A396HH18_MEDTR|nr:hypothetical protein MtrunA17_Chr6g0454731 [Medicago truncatula]